MADKKMPGLLIGIAGKKPGMSDSNDDMPEEKENDDRDLAAEDAISSFRSAIKNDDDTAAVSALKEAIEILMY